MYLSDEKKSLLNRALFRKKEKYEVSFAKGESLLDSKSIYRIYLKKYVLEVKLEGNARGLEKVVFESLHSFNTDSSLRSFKYKIIFNALPTNKKFKNIYGKFCYICKKEIDEDIEHILFKCEGIKECKELVKEKLKDKIAINIYDKIRYGYGVCRDDYVALSCYASVIWRVRNILKHNSEKQFNVLFKRFFRNCYK